MLQLGAKCQQHEIQNGLVEPGHSDGNRDLGELRVLLLQTSDEFDFSLAGAGEPE